MLNSLIIKNYRNIKSLEIPALARVNLFSGQNNVGKTTLLEAIYLYAFRGNLHHIQKVLKFREEWTPVDKGSIDEKSQQLITNYLNIFLDRKADFFGNKKIQIGANETNQQLGIKFIKQAESQELTKLEKNKVLPKVALHLRFSNKEHILSNLATAEQNNFLIVPNKCAYISSGLKASEISVNFWKKIVFTPKEKMVLDALRIIEPQIERLIFLDSNQKTKPFVKLKNKNGAIPLKSMGMGINRLLLIILALLNTENGFLLLDEFEDGLHYTVQQKLWEIIFRIAQQFNTQVFATTYSNDCIKAFATVCSEQKSIGQYFYLQKSKEKLTPLMYANELLLFAAHQNIEAR